MHLFTLIIIFSSYLYLVLKMMQCNSVFKNNVFVDFLNKYEIRPVASASGVDDNCLQSLQSLPQLKLKFKNNFIEKSYIFLSNSDEYRFNTLYSELYSHDKNTIIWELRGGYGSARLIDKLLKLQKPLEEKIFIGYSDITALHLFLSQHWGWKTIHGSVLSEFLKYDKDPGNLLKIANIILKKDTTLKISELKPMNKLAEDVSNITGKLTGGNLTIVQTSLGTPWQIETKDKILFLEDIGEKSFRIDRSLNHMKQAGIFNEVEAIVFGEFTNSDEYINDTLKQFALSINVPIYKTNKFGHGYSNYPLVYNADAVIELDSLDTGFSFIMQL